MTRFRTARAEGRVSALRLKALLPALLVAACSAAATPTAAPPSPAVALTVGLGYIPSVQFAQFYYAQQAGYYRDAGLQVTFQNKIDPDLVTLVGQGSVDIGLADGTSVIPAASQGIPVKYVATVYAKNPNVVLAKASSGIRTAADLKGKRLGIPGKYGSSWIMLQALLKSVGLTPDDLQIILYPDFGQAAALQQGAIDAATGFANNEPIQLQAAGITLVIISVDAATPLPGPGLITGAATLKAKSASLKPFVAATLRAMKAIESDPKQGLDAAIAAVPELGQDRDGQLSILQATAAMWESDYTRAHGSGAVDPSAWAASIGFMASIGLVATPVTADQLVTSELLPGP